MKPLMFFVGFSIFALAVSAARATDYLEDIRNALEEKGGE